MHKRFLCVFSDICQVQKTTDLVSTKETYITCDYIQKRPILRAITYQRNAQSLETFIYAKEVIYQKRDQQYHKKRPTLHVQNGPTYACQTDSEIKTCCGSVTSFIHTYTLSYIRTPFHTYIHPFIHTYTLSYIHKPFRTYIHPRLDSIATCVYFLVGHTYIV